MAERDYNGEIAALSQTLSGIEQVLDLPKLKVDVAKLEEEAPFFPKRISRTNWEQGYHKMLSDPSNEARLCVCMHNRATLDRLMRIEMPRVGSTAIRKLRLSITNLMLKLCTWLRTQTLLKDAVPLG